MMIIIKPILILVFVITIPLTFIITNSLSKIIRLRYRKRNKLLGDLSGFAEEMISGQKTISSFGVESEVIDKYSKINKECSEAMKSSGQVSTLSGPLVNFISNFSMSLVALFSGILYFFEQISIGKVTSFMLYSRRFSGPINQISNLLADIQSGLAACERVFVYIDLPRDISDLELLPYNQESNGSDIEFKNVNFAYDSTNYVLKNIDFRAYKGKTTAIVGHTGSGKTTLISLIMRFYDEYSGVILLDDTDIKTLKKGDTRKAITMILQDSWLFNGTIKDNITYGNDDCSDEEIAIALKNANIDKFVSRLANGVDTYLSDDGIKISKGEKQLLVICRAFLSKNKMLILDEATSNVDTFTERKIHKAITQLMIDKTCFVIAHRLSTIRNADMIIVMENGFIVETGTNKELLEKKGKYFEMVSSQYL
jgi:ATP-binding cassette subfamily B protein